MTTIKDIENTFKPHSDPARAAQMAAYMRNQFDFYGIGASERRNLSKAYIEEGKKSNKIDWKFSTTLFSHPYREVNYLGLDILKSQSHLLTIDDFENLVDLAEIRPWWDTIDNIDSVIGSLGHDYEDFEEKILDLAASDNFWLRRIAIGHQRKYKDKTNTDLLARIIKINLNIPCRDKDEIFFIDKAIGWALREYSKTNPLWVRSFINEEINVLSRLSIREASKYLQ